MQQVQINIESTNLSEQTQPVLLSLLILFVVANLVLVQGVCNRPCIPVGLDCGFGCLKGAVFVLGLNPLSTDNVVRWVVQMFNALLAETGAKKLFKKNNR